MTIFHDYLSSLNYSKLTSYFRFSAVIPTALPTVLVFSTCSTGTLLPSTVDTPATARPGLVLVFLPTGEGDREIGADEPFSAVTLGDFTDTAVSTIDGLTDAIGAGECCLPVEAGDFTDTALEL